MLTLRAKLLVPLSLASPWGGTQVLSRLRSPAWLLCSGESWCCRCWVLGHLPLDSQQRRDRHKESDGVRSAASSAVCHKAGSGAHLALEANMGSCYLWPLWGKWSGHSPSQLLSWSRPSHKLQSREWWASGSTCRSGRGQHLVLYPGPLSPPPWNWSPPQTPAYGMGSWHSSGFCWGGTGVHHLD